MEKILNKIEEYRKNRKTGFPHTNMFGMPMGWKARGEMDSDYGFKKVVTHKFCNSIVHIGIEGEGGLFRYCNQCLIKVDRVDKVD